MNKSKNNRELSIEEACLFQLILSKKIEFITFFSEFFINLPGFLRLYKDKFFSKLNEFIDDKNYINILKDKCQEIPLNYKSINELDEKYLGSKRKREKMYNIDEDSKFSNKESKYDAELKLLQNDYLKLDLNNDESSEYLLVKKDKNVEILSSIPPITVNIKKIEVDKEEKNKNSDNNNDILKINKNYKAINDDKKTNNIYITLEDKDEKIINEEIKNSLNSELKEREYKKKISSNDRHVKFDDKDEIISPIRMEKNNNNLIRNKFLQKFSSKLISLEEITSLIDNSLSNEDLFMSENSEYINKLIPSNNAPKPRFEKIPTMNIPKKRCDIQFNNSETLLKENEEKNNNEDKIKETQNSKNNISNIKNNNNNINNASNKIINEKSENIEIQNKITIDNNNKNIQIDNEEKMKRENIEDINNNNGNIKENKTSSNEEEEQITITDDNITEHKDEIVKNENIIILNTLLLEYNNSNGNKIIRNFKEIPNSIIIQKKILNIPDISFPNNNQKSKKKYVKKNEKKISNEKNGEIKNNELYNITKISNIKSNIIENNYLPKNTNPRRRNVILMEKTICEEDNFYHENIKNKNIKTNKNNANNEKLETTDILHDFNYLYQQKSQ